MFREPQETSEEEYEKEKLRKSPKFLGLKFHNYMILISKRISREENKSAMDIPIFSYEKLIKRMYKADYSIKDATIVIKNKMKKENILEKKEANHAKRKGRKENKKTINISEELQRSIYEILSNIAYKKLEEAEYQGRKVTLNKPMQGDVKKFKVYVKDPKTGNIKKVNFGDPNMRIKKNNPERRKSFRARHNCDNPGPKTKARYWSCKKW